MPVRAIIILFDVWHTNVLLAEICDKIPAEIRILFLTSAGFHYFSRFSLTVLKSTSHIRVFFLRFCVTVRIYADINYKIKISNKEYTRFSLTFTRKSVIL